MCPGDKRPKKTEEQKTKRERWIEYAGAQLSFELSSRNRRLQSHRHHHLPHLPHLPNRPWHQLAASHQANHHQPQVPLHPQSPFHHFVAAVPVVDNTAAADDDTRARMSGIHNPVAEVAARGIRRRTRQAEDRAAAVHRMHSAASSCSQRLFPSACSGICPCCASARAWDSERPPVRS